MQTALTEQIIPQLAQAAAAQVNILQYLFHDEQQPFREQFIQDIQAALNPSRHLSEQANIDNYGQMFASQQTFLGQGMSNNGYVINPDLIIKTGEFAQAAIYQRLYE